MGANRGLVNDAAVSGAITPGLLTDWLATLPAAATTDESLAVLGHLASRIAARRGCEHPSALDPAEHPAARSAPEPILAPDLLGPAWETMMASIDKRARGAHFTDRSIADEVCRHAFDQAAFELVPTVWDPAVGGGAFLLAAARQVESTLELDRADIVTRLFGSDVDRVAVQIADAALELWSNGTARPNISVGDSLLDEFECHPARGFDMVLGNPPFLGQLAGDTVRSSDRNVALLGRYGAAVRGYVDEAGLFLLLAVRACVPVGVASMIVPQSLLGSSSATPLRQMLEEEAELMGVWVGDSGSFAAAVDVAAPVLRRTPRSIGRKRRDAIKVWRSIGPPMEMPRPGPRSWGSALAGTLGVPAVTLHGAELLGNVATVTSGFRQHFYGLSGAVREADVSDPEHLMLITSGAIDPLHLRWGSVDVRFAGKRWTRPIVHIDAIQDDAVAQWFRDRCKPKVLVASQTRVVEAVGDPHGHLLPSVPVLTIEPIDPAMIWHVAAMLSAPAVSAVLASSAAGTGLSEASFRVRAKDVAALPLPTDRDAWQKGADLAEVAQNAASNGRWIVYRQTIESLASTMDGAFEIAGAEIFDWWHARVRFPEDS